MKRFRKEPKNTAKTAWVALGGLLALGLTFIVVQEFPSMRREARLMRM